MQAQKRVCSEVTVSNPALLLVFMEEVVPDGAELLVSPRVLTLDIHERWIDKRLIGKGRIQETNGDGLCANSHCHVDIAQVTEDIPSQAVQ